MTNKNLPLVGIRQDTVDGVNLSDNDICSINNSLLGYSRKWNREFVSMNREGDNLVNSANLLNAQTGDFNRYIGIMYNQLQEIVSYLTGR